MKRLFEVKSGGQSLRPPQFFDTKHGAKIFMKGTNATTIVKGLHVAIGPDHWRYGEEGNQRTHSHNMRSGGTGNGFKVAKKRRAVA